jgi:hypothetical protein
VTVWLRVEIREDDKAHATPGYGKATFCGQDPMYPMGAGDLTCAECLSAVEAQDAD